MENSEFKRHIGFDREASLTSGYVESAAACDMVNHPPHYNHGKIEVIKIIEDQLNPDEYRGYIKGQVLKYVTREKYKNGLEDLRKAAWYLNHLIKYMERNNMK